MTPMRYPRYCNYGWSGAAMWTYYLFMGLLIATMALWGIAALRDDGHENGSRAAGKSDGDAST